MSAQVNYTEEQTAQMVHDYQAGVSLEEIATNLGKSVRSVIAKLTREGAYKSKSKKGAQPRQTKADLIQHCEQLLELAPGTLSGLEKCTLEIINTLAVSLASKAGCN